MFLQKLLFLFSVLTLHINQGEKQWVILPLSESYEYQVIDGEGALTLHEHQKLFFERGFTIEHMEIHREVIQFEDKAAVKEWIRTEMAPKLGKHENELFVEEYFGRMETKGWLNAKDGKIRFPRQQLLVLLTNK